MKKLLLVLLLLGAVGVGATAVHDRWSTATTPLPRRDEFKPVAIKRGRIIEAVNATGVVQPRRVAIVGTDTSGRVVEIEPGADFNKSVAKDAPLLKLDDRLARQKFVQANRAVELAEADIARAQVAREARQLAVQRQEELIQKKVGLQRDLDTANAELKVADAVLRAAQVRKSEAEAAQQLAQLGVDAMVVRAPIAGIIIDRKVAVGQAVSPLTATPLFTIAGSLEAMEAHAQVPESDISKVRVGQRAVFSLSDPSGDDSPVESKRTRFEGKVGQIRPMPANLQGAVFYTVVIDVHNQRDPETREWQLRPGLPVAVDIIRREHANAWLVPTDALDFKLDEHYQSAEAKKKAQEWEQQSGASPGRADWKQIWILDASEKPWPIHVRTGGKNSKGESGLRGTQDATEDGSGAEYQEVLEWEPDPNIQPVLESDDPARFPEVITDAPPVQKRSLFDVPRIPKIF